MAESTRIRMIKYFESTDMLDQLGWISLIKMYEAAGQTPYEYPEVVILSDVQYGYPCIGKDYCAVLTLVITDANSRHPLWLRTHPAISLEYVHQPGELSAGFHFNENMIKLVTLVHSVVPSMLAELSAVDNKHDVGAVYSSYSYRFFTGLESHVHRQYVEIFSRDKVRVLDFKNEKGIWNFKPKEWEKWRMNQQVKLG